MDKCNHAHAGMTIAQSVTCMDIIEYNWYFTTVAVAKQWPCNVYNILQKQNLVVSINIALKVVKSGWAKT